MSNVENQMSKIKCQKSNVKNQMSKIKCQMTNVNKIKLLSERTSGAPPVIFSFGNSIEIFVNMIHNSLMKVGCRF